MQTRIRASPLVFLLLKSGIPDRAGESEDEGVGKLERMDGIMDISGMYLYAISAVAL